MQTLEARILISAADQASKVFGAIGGHARELAERIEKTGHSFTLAKQMAAGWKGELESTARIMRNTGLIMTGAISAPIGLFAKSTLAAAKTHIEAQAQIRASLRSTGREVEFTAKQLGAMAKEVSNATTFDDTQILEGTNALLKFGRIHGQVFERAEKAAVDLAAAQHMEVREAAETLGIALQDPDKSARKLRGIGIVLGEFQKAQIHNLQLTGQTAKAQGIIMDAVAKAFIGQAKELGDTPVGQMRQLEIAVEDTKKALGEDLAEALKPFVVQARNAAREVEHLAKMNTGLAGGLAAVALASGPALTFLGQLGLAAFALQGPLKGIAVAALAFTRTLWPLGAAIGVAGLVAGLFKLGKSHKSAADFARDQAEAEGILRGALDRTSGSVNRLSAAELARQRQIGGDKLSEIERSLKDKTGAFAGNAFWDIRKAIDRGETHNLPPEALATARSFSEGKIGLSQFEAEIVRLRDKMTEGPQKDFLRKFIDESVNPALKELQDLEEALKRQKKIIDELARAKPASGLPAVIPPRPPAYRFPPGGYVPPPHEPVPQPFHWPSAGATPGLGAPGGWRVPGGISGPPRMPGATPGARGGGGTPPVGLRPDRHTASIARGAHGLYGASKGDTNIAMSAAMDQLAKEGVPKEHLRAAAAVLVGNATLESKLNPNAVHDSGTGYGIYGARLERRTSMLNWLEASGFPRNSLEGQMRFMAHEAMTVRRFAPTRSALMGATAEGIEDDASIVMRTFEAPRAGPGANEASRRAAARAAFGFAGSEIEIARSAAGQRPGTSTFAALSGGSNLAEMFARGGGRLPSTLSQVEIGKGTVDLNVSVDGPGKISGIKPLASGNFDFGDITVDRVGQRFKRPSGLR